jgi:hypothetical protein
MFFTVDAVTATNFMTESAPTLDQRRVSIPNKIRQV